MSKFIIGLIIGAVFATVVIAVCSMGRDDKND